MTEKIKGQGIFKEGYGFIAKKVMRDRDLNVLSKAVYAYICSYTGKGKNAFPSQNLICGDLGIGKDTLIKYVRELKDRGYVTVIQHKEKGKFAQNLYTVNINQCIVSPDTAKTDTDFIGHGQRETNNNSINNNIKDKNINNTHTRAEEKAVDNLKHEEEFEKEKSSNAPVEIQDILKKYKELKLPAYNYCPDNYVILKVWRELGTLKLFEALTEMSKSEFVKNSMSINSIFKIDNLKKALNGNFKDKRKMNAEKNNPMKKFKKPEYKDFTGDFINSILNGALEENENEEM